MRRERRRRLDVHQRPLGGFVARVGRIPRHLQPDGCGKRRDRERRTAGQPPIGRHLKSRREKISTDSTSSPAM